MTDNELVSPELAAEAMLVAVRAGDATLAKGAKSSAVLALQKALAALGAQLTPDGSFGPKTHAAIVAEQAAAGLSEDGVVDAATLMAIDLRLAAKKKSALFAAMAEAVGVDPTKIKASAPARATAPAPTSHDQAYFIDADQLVGPNPSAVDDPDSPPPARDAAAPLVARGTPLSGDRAAAFTEVRKKIEDNQPACAALDRLLAAGRFHKGSLLPNLLEMARFPRNPELLVQAGIEPALLLMQAIRHVDNPLRVQQGRGHGTCGAGVMEYLILRRDPAEFVRLVDGITREASEARLKSGRALTMPRSAIARDNSGRVDVDRFFQSAIMNHASSMSWLFDYDNPNDNDSFWSAVQGDSQMPVWGFSNLYEAMMGESCSSATVLSRSGEELAELVFSRSAQGEKVPVIMRFSTLHWLSVEWLERGADAGVTAVALRNPWGFDEGGDQPRRVALPEGGGRVRMVKADFIGAVFGAVVKG